MSAESQLREKLLRSRRCSPAPGGAVGSGGGAGSDPGASRLAILGKHVDRRPSHGRSSIFFDRRSNSARLYCDRMSRSSFSCNATSAIGRWQRCAHRSLTEFGLGEYPANRVRSIGGFYGVSTARRSTTERSCPRYPIFLLPGSSAWLRFWGRMARFQYRSPRGGPASRRVAFRSR